ncbi:hypothetical protein [Brucella tritici]|uniref:Transposase n=1 Tax=Brucella tritici TaxID=94626 RepID=A0A6L3Y4D8_9HYPH|nr:hypothetical protein [Brucella tritici]KAB2673825.1 hypothetical protein F9L08_29025 [Brucella tritici]
MGAMAKEFPPFATLQYQFYRMRDNGLPDLINEILVAVTRLTESRKAEPAKVFRLCSYDAGKKNKGRKRRIVADMLGNKLEGASCMVLTFRTGTVHPIRS